MASLAFQEGIRCKESLLRELVFLNPNPDQVVVGIDFVSAGTGVSPVLAAITYEVVPEPRTLTLLGLGILVLLGRPAAVRASIGAMKPGNAGGGKIRRR